MSDQKSPDESNQVTEMRIKALEDALSTPPHRLLPRLGSLETWRTYVTGAVAALAAVGFLGVFDGEKGDIGPQGPRGLAGLSVPHGTILPYYGTTNQVPDRFLICDGTNVTTNNYPELCSVLTNANKSLMVSDQVVKLPDLRGMFLRGLDAGGMIVTNEQGRLLGSLQRDTVGPHEHRVGFRVDGSIGSNGPKVNPAVIAVTPPDVAQFEKTRGILGGTPSTETRPVNVAVNFIIKY